MPSESPDGMGWILQKFHIQVHLISKNTQSLSMSAVNILMTYSCLKSSFLMLFPALPSTSGLLLLWDSSLG